MAMMTSINKRPKTEKGISIIEILVVIFIIAITLLSLLGVASLSLKISQSKEENVQANNLIQESIEAVRNFRDGTDWHTNGLGTLFVNTDYFPRKSGSPPSWQLILGIETIDSFARKVIFSDVRRDVNGNIVESGGVIDPETKKATFTVSWEDKKIEIATYFTNWRR